MKYTIVFGSLLLSCSLFAIKELQEIVLHFNDGHQRSLSAELAQYVPELTSYEQSSEVDFSLLFSSDWDTVVPFLPLVQDIRTAPE